MPGPIVDIYCRVASGGEEGTRSLDEQEAAGRQYCLENGLAVGVVHREIFNGFHYNGRQGLEAMRRRYRKGEIQGVVVYRFDRLSRSTVHLAILMQEMEQYHAQLYAVQGWGSDTIGNRILLILHDFLAEVEREKSVDILSLPSKH